MTKPFLGWSSNLYPLACEDVAAVSDWSGAPIPEEALPSDDVILLIQPHGPDALVRGRARVTALLKQNPTSTLAVRIVFVPSIPRWNLLWTCVKKLRTPFRYKSPGRYHMDVRYLRTLGLERGVRSAQNMAPGHETRVHEMRTRLRTEGYDETRPINIHVCRWAGLMDSLCDGHHRVSACCELGISRVTVCFSAAGALPHVVRAPACVKRMHDCVPKGTDAFLRGLIRAGTSLIPIKSIRKKARRAGLVWANQWRLARVRPFVRALAMHHLLALQRRVAHGEKVRVAFLISDDSMFSGESVFRLMRQDPQLSCRICVAPRLGRDEKFRTETQARTVSSLATRYGQQNVVALHPGDGARIDDDVVVSTILYEDQTYLEFSTQALVQHSLVVMLYYGYGGLFRSNEERTPFLPNLAWCWRFFVSNEPTREMMCTRNPWLLANTFVTGYAKMDRLAPLLAQTKPRARPCIILAPHHTIDASSDWLQLSTFLQHAELYLQLPKRFPNVDFVFRPHPLLFPRLASARWWGEEKTSRYRTAIAAYPNVTFQQGGDYFETFAAADALIHDCGSFLAEFFYTGKKQCYLLKSEASMKKQFLPFAQKLLSHVTCAYTGEEIIAFIERVVADFGAHVPPLDPLVRRDVCVNFPHASENVVQQIMVPIRRNSYGY